jgi:phosphonoacetaldehyde hydrolase
VNRLEAVIFDWAGTTVDFGSIAPVEAITELFAARGIQLTHSDVRRDMGLFKKDHIRRILQLPHVEAQWQQRNSRKANESDVEALFCDFTSTQMKTLEKHSELIRGVANMVAGLRERGLKIGSTTGYTKPMLDLLLARASEQGYRPDLSYCPEDVNGGRPRPWMCLRLALDFRLSSTAVAVKVGDTPSDIEEGLNAGMWTIGIALTGNELGLSSAIVSALSTEDYKKRLEHAYGRLKAAGAHYVIDSVADMKPAIEDLEQRMAAGERP